MRQQSTKRAYGNVAVYDPEGVLLFRCSRKRASSYLKKKIATLRKPKTEEPFSIDLKFIPQGPGHKHNDFYLSWKNNICAVCGNTHNLVRRHIVMTCYWRFLKDEIKSGNSHDIVPLCRMCAAKWDRRSSDYQKVYANEFKVPILGTQSYYDKPLRNARRAYLTLQRMKRAIPSVARQKLVTIIELYTIGKFADLDENGLKELLTEPILWKGREHITHAELVVRKYKSIDNQWNFVESWRKWFLKSMNPTRLPEAWSVEHRPNKVIIFLSSESRGRKNIKPKSVAS